MAMTEQPLADHERPLLTPPPVEDVFARAEELRAADYPDVPAELLQRVLAAERDNPGDRVAASSAVTRTIDAYLAETGSAAAASDQEGTV